MILRMNLRTNVRMNLRPNLARFTAVLCFFAMLYGCYTPYNLPVRVETNKIASVMEVNDATQMVTMGSPYVYVEKPDVDWAKAREDAKAVCLERTGMAGAEPVGRTRRKCMSQVGTNCVRYAIVGDYKCVALPDDDG